VARALGTVHQCSICGRPNNLLAHFCRHCGARLSAPEEVTAANEPGLPVRPGLSAPEIAPGAISPFGFLFSRLAAARGFLNPGRDPRRVAYGGKSNSGPLATTRRAPVLFAACAAAMVAILALVGWQVHWPGALFAAKPSPAAQVGVAAGVRSSPGLSGQQPSGPATAAGSPAQVVPSPSASAAATGPASPADTGGPAVPRVSTPAVAVRAYFAAINSRNYAKAWRLGGRNTGVSYAAFTQGFSGTARDVVTLLSLAGPVVTARLAAYQSDGAIKTFQGTYTVKNGVITQFEVRQVG
jgi:hypothetical protein